MLRGQALAGGQQKRGVGRHGCHFKPATPAWLACPTLYVLCRWVQAECRGLSDVDAPEVNPLLQRAAAALRERQVCVHVYY